MDGPVDSEGAFQKTVVVVDRRRMVIAGQKLTKSTLRCSARTIICDVCSNKHQCVVRTVSVSTLIVWCTGRLPLAQKIDTLSSRDSMIHVHDEHHFQNIWSLPVGNILLLIVKPICISVGSRRL